MGLYTVIATIACVITITAERLGDFAIEAWALNSRTLCAFVEAAFGLGETRRVTCQPGTVGGRVKIVLGSNEPLQLCEVQVFGARSRLLFSTSHISQYNKTSPYAC